MLITEIPKRYVLACMLGLLGSVGTVVAQETKPLRIVVPFAPGGAGDVVARVIAPLLGERLQRQVIVENKAGASTIVGAEAVARAAPDGNTLLLTTDATIAINPWLFSKLPYDPQNDLMPVTMVVNMPLVLVAGPKMEAASVEQLIAHARKAPGSISYASVGGGSPQQLAMVLFNKLSSTQMNHIPYKGGAPAVTDVAGGQVDLFFAAIGTAAPFLANGKLKPLGLTGRQRHPSIPNVPTIAEAGLPAYDMSVWLGLFAPAGTPSSVIDRIQREVARIVQEPQVKDRWVKLGAEGVGDTPMQFAETIRRDTDKWGRLIRESNIKAD